jgi:hypothetical protein
MHLEDDATAPLPEPLKRNPLAAKWRTHAPSRSGAEDDISLDEHGPYPSPPRVLGHRPSRERVGLRDDNGELPSAVGREDEILVRATTV